MHLLEPLHDMLGVAAMSAGLAPGEPLGKGFRLPAGHLWCVVRSFTIAHVHHGAHVHQAEGAAGQRLPAAGAGGETIGASGGATWTRLIQ